MERTYHLFKRILVANRGEIAVRIMRTAKKMGIESVAIYTTEETEALHVEKADLKALLKGSSLNETYLNAQQIVDLAKKYHAEAVHPGYGFLAENAAFAELCGKNNIVFIGPSPKNIAMMGDKEQANNIALQCGVPLLPKIQGSRDEMLTKAPNVKFPVVIKASGGGGGKGMRIVQKPDKLSKEIDLAADEANRYFKNNLVYIEPYIQNPRHIEVQILGDTHGNIIHLYDRDCSIQRRHQKVIEEAPAPNVPDLIRNKIIDDSLKMARHINYKNAGTMEFLLTADNKHYFLEMNTRIQVEHPVSEQITGIDIVKEQILIAAGHPLAYSQDDIQICGHAIEARIYAEDPDNNFQPSFGKIKSIHIPSHPHIRIDGGSKAKDNLNPNFDPLLKKVIASGKNRKQAIDRLHDFIEDYALFGVKTNRELIFQTLSDRDFIKGNYGTSFFNKKFFKLLNEIKLKNKDIKILTAAYLLIKKKIKNKLSTEWHNAGHWRINDSYKICLEKQWIEILVLHEDEHEMQYSANQTNFSIRDTQIEENSISFILDDEYMYMHYWNDGKGLFHIQYKGLVWEISDIPERREKQHQDSLPITKTLNAPIPGRIIEISVHEGDAVKKGDLLMVLEAMKTENNIMAWTDAVISKIEVAKGQHVGLNQLLLEIE